MVARRRLKLLFCIFNDGAYGAEIDKLRADGVDVSGSVFGYTDFAAIAKASSLAYAAPMLRISANGRSCSMPSRRTPRCRTSTSTTVIAPQTRRGISAGHGVR